MNRDGYDVQWVIYHGSAWDMLVEQGYVTQHLQMRYGQQWATMVKPMTYMAGKQGERYWQ